MQFRIGKFENRTNPTFMGWNDTGFLSNLFWFWLENPNQFQLDLVLDSYTTIH